jgi:hypothetical protein
MHVTPPPSRETHRQALGEGATNWNDYAARLSRSDADSVAIS